MDEVTLQVDVYEIDDWVGEFQYIWDFGGFMCRGNAAHPVSLVKQHEAYQMAFDGQTLEWREETPSTRKEATMYSFDYGLFVLAAPKKADAVAVDEKAYRIVDTATNLEDDDEEWIVLRGISMYSDERVVKRQTFEKRIRRGTWLPLVGLADN